MRTQSTQEEEEFVGLRFIHRAGTDRSGPLVILVHGRAGNAQVMWAFDRLIPAQATVVSFEAFLEDPLGGFSWWYMDSKDPVRPAILRARDRLCYAIERYVEIENIRPSKRVAMGFSQGSVLLSAALLTGKLSLEGLGILAGVAFEGEEPPVINGRPRILIAHGTQDEVLTVDRARAGAQRLRMLGLDVTYVEEEVGHKVGVQGTRALKEWLAETLAR
jgi:phospholipase/carboxylesterase